MGQVVAGGIGLVAPPAALRGDLDPAPPRFERLRLADVTDQAAAAALFTATPRTAWVKRALDVVAASVLLLLLVPVFAIISVAIYLSDRGPVIYRQRRVGRDNEVFRIWKFRSMVRDADKMVERYAGQNVSNGLLFKIVRDPRVTRVGSLIRRLSIDELPQLVNVLVGDMSLVGPRPLPVDPEQFDPTAARRHQVRPGITGPWQVRGHVLGYREMIRLDLEYIEQWSVRRDLRLLAQTIPAILVRRSPAY